MTIAAQPLGWDQRPLSELIEHILERYHAPLRSELPRLIELAYKVEDAHADSERCPHGLAQLLTEVLDSVEGHLQKEEQILFPMFLSGRGAMAHMPVQVMLQEHEDHEDNLVRIHQLTSGLTPPDEACESWRELYRGLHELEVDLMDHIHLENDVLFPRALAG
ncbi:MAG: hemerythrin domain-containing protein [Myxococcales bacterium]|nr:hemerythrin domain-containing protein [Myxococcales bacterium]